MDYIDGHPDRESADPELVVAWRSAGYRYRPRRDSASMSLQARRRARKAGEQVEGEEFDDYDDDDDVEVVYAE